MIASGYLEFASSQNTNLKYSYDCKWIFGVCELTKYKFKIELWLQVDIWILRAHKIQI